MNFESRMNNSLQRYVGEWWVPARADHDIKMMFMQPEGMMGHERKYTGTLTYYGDQDTTLSLYHVPSNFHSKHYHQNDVMWGRDANGHIFTLFNVLKKEQRMGDFTETKFVVGLILVGEHVLYTEDTRFKRCIVQYPYLRNWAFNNQITGKDVNEGISFNTSINSTVLLESVCEDGIFWRMRQYPEIERTLHDLRIAQKTELEIEVKRPCSIWTYLRQVEEFSQFLSIALYGDQNPTEIKFENRENGNVCHLLFKNDKSVNPDVSTLIKFEHLKEKLPSMLKVWHENFEKMAPISSYLIESLNKKNRFDVPDFLIIAQALDGYHKRFVNKKNGKDHRKYEDGIKILLSQFKEVDCVQRCHIDPIVLKDSRDKYSHLYPDDEESKAVEGEDLYWLTEKCKILLTCCILNMLGLTNSEINLCIERSPIQNIIDSSPFEFEK